MSPAPAALPFPGRRELQYRAGSDTRRGVRMFFLTGFDGEVADNSLLFTADGGTLVSCGEDRRVRVWDVAERRLRKAMRGHQDFATCVCLVPDTPLAVTGSWDHTVRVWDIAAGRMVKKFTVRGTVVGLDLSPDGKTLAAVGGEWYATSADTNCVWRWEVRTWKALPPICPHDTPVGVVRYSPDGRLLITGAADRFARVWDLGTGEEIARLRHTAWLQGLAVHGQTLAAVAGKRLTLWDLPEGDRPARERLVVTPFQATALAVAFSRDGKLLAVGGKDGIVRVWDMEQGRFRHVFRWKIGEVRAVCFAPDGMTMAAGGIGKIVVWDVD